MTVPATAQPFTERLPTDLERAAADHLRTIIAEGMTRDDGSPTLYVHRVDEDPQPVTLTPLISDVMLELLRHLAKGEAVTLVPMGEMLTTQQAADILNVSRPHLVKLLEKGDIPHSMTGRHRRIRADDLFAYKRARDERRSDALGELAAADADIL
jgi:excisionase family DNA binding protein